MAHRNHLARTRLSPDHWALVRADKTAAAYDREAYEYEPEAQKTRAGWLARARSGSGSARGENGVRILLHISHYILIRYIF
jgi:hypothetical protein